MPILNFLLNFVEKSTKKLAFYCCSFNQRLFKWVDFLVAVTGLWGVEKLIYRQIYDLNNKITYGIFTLVVFKNKIYKITCHIFLGTESKEICCVGDDKVIDFSLKKNLNCGGLSWRLEQIHIYSENFTSRGSI